MGSDVRDRRGHADVRRSESRAGGSTRNELMAGGTEGNERLTVVTGALLIVVLAGVGVTIVFIGRLLWWHLFLGMAVIGPVALKVGSTGYRFTRYYTAAPAYRRKGPPPPALRALGPALLGLTAIVLATGVALLLIGPSSRGTLLLVHKVSFICWVVVTASTSPGICRNWCASTGSRGRPGLSSMNSVRSSPGSAEPPNHR